MKHTPGKWKLYENESGVWVGVENSEYVCNFKPVSKIMPMNLDAGNPNVANARLIAAAPEMLEVLELVKSALALGVKGTLLDQVESIIKKARGEK